MSWIRVFLSFRGRLGRDRYMKAFQILSFVVWLPAVPLYQSDITVKIAGERDPLGE